MTSSPWNSTNSYRGAAPATRFLVTRVSPDGSRRAAYVSQQVDRRCGRESGCQYRDRHAATTVELAIILPVLMLLLIGLCVLELGTFRYQQIAALAHESARWASVHGKEYAKQTGQSIADAEDILENVIKPRAHGLHLSKLTHELHWDEGENLVTVRIVYTWTPEAFFTPQTMTCTAIALATY